MFSPKNRCLLYFTDNRLAIHVKSYHGRVIYDTEFPDEWYKPLTISCRIPKKIESMVPRAVSLTTTNDYPKKAHNSLRVIYEKPNKKKESFDVCHKPFRYPVIPDLSLRLIEWLELLRILGVNKVFIYSMNAHYGVERVLDYYQKTVNITKLLH